MVVPKKSLGQNFLRDENIAKKIVGGLKLNRNEPVLEIGPGTGALTAHLIQAAGRYLGVEVDDRSLELLRNRFPAAEFLRQDILTVGLGDIARRMGGPLRIVGNIPYYITSPILFWVIDQRNLVIDATFMMQLEVARRLAAVPRTKEYGILSVISQLYGVPAVMFKVSRNSFFPRPTVDSAVVHIAMRKDTPVHDEQLLRSIVRGTFGKRRKTLYNGLQFMGYSDGVLNKITGDLRRRPEELSVDEFIDLTNQLKKETARN